MRQVASVDKSLFSLTSSHLHFKLGHKRGKKMQKTAEHNADIFPTTQQRFTLVSLQRGQQLM